MNKVVNNKKYHCIFNKVVKICSIGQVKSLLKKGYYIKEVYHGPDWAPATYFYLGKEKA